MPLSENDYGAQTIIRRSPRLDRLYKMRCRQLSPTAIARNDVIWHLARAAGYRHKDHRILARHELTLAREALTALHVARLRETAAMLERALGTPHRHLVTSHCARITGSSALIAAGFLLLAASAFAADHPDAVIPTPQMRVAMDGLVMGIEARASRAKRSRLPDVVQGAWNAAVEAEINRRIK